MANVEKGALEKLRSCPGFELGNPLRNHFPRFIERHGPTLVSAFDAAVNRRQGVPIHVDLFRGWHFQFQVNHTLEDSSHRPSETQSHSNA
jgi:hypothetical protein